MRPVRAVKLHVAPALPEIILSRKTLLALKNPGA
jgi:hypothetical protein